MQVPLRVIAEGLEIVQRGEDALLVDETLEDGLEFAGTFRRDQRRVVRCDNGVAGNGGAVVCLGIVTAYPPCAVDVLLGDRPRLRHFGGAQPKQPSGLVVGA